MNAFSSRLRQLRNDAGITQDELAKIIGVSKSSVNMYERGEREPGFETMEAIADYFNVDMDYLYGRSDVKNAAKRAYDSMFIEPKVRNELLYYTMYKYTKDSPIDYDAIPEADREPVRKAAQFIEILNSLSEKSRDELSNYARYIAQKEAESKKK